MNAPSAGFYHALNLDITVECFESTLQIFLKKMRRYDLAASLYPNWKRELAGISRVQAKRKISFFDPDYFLSRLPLTLKIKRENMHDLENNFKILEKLSLPMEFVSPKTLFLTSNGVLEKKIILHPTASSLSKFYPFDFWRGILESFLEKGDSVLLLCWKNPQEVDFCQKLIEACKNKERVQLLVGAPLLKVAQLLCECQLFIGLDSAMAQLAGLLDVFTVALWSFADYKRIYPYGNHVHVYLPKEVYQRKEYLFGYPQKTPAYLKRADFKTVLEIASLEKKEDFVIKPFFKSPVKFYLY